MRTFPPISCIHPHCRPVFVDMCNILCTVTSEALWYFASLASGHGCVGISGPHSLMWDNFDIQHEVHSLREHRLQSLSCSYTNLSNDSAVCAHHYCSMLHGRCSNSQGELLRVGKAGVPLRMLKS